MNIFRNNFYRINLEFENCDFYSKQFYILSSGRANDRIKIVLGLEVPIILNGNYFYIGVHTSFVKNVSFLDDNFDIQKLNKLNSRYESRWIITI